MPKLEISFTFGKTTLIRRLLVMAMVNHNGTGDFLKLSLNFCLTISTMIWVSWISRTSQRQFIIQRTTRATGATMIVSKFSDMPTIAANTYPWLRPCNQKQSLQKTLHYFTTKELCLRLGLYGDTLTLLLYILNLTSLIYENASENPMLPSKKKMKGTFLFIGQNNVGVRNVYRSYPEGLN